VDKGTLIAAIAVMLTVVGVTVKVVAWVFKAAVNAALDPMEIRLVRIEARQGLLWGIAEQRAMETLHHAEQPDFDFLIEQFKEKTLTGQQLTQFIERLEVIASGTEPRMSEQFPAARLLLNSAIRERAAREGLPDRTTEEDEHTQVYLDENVAAAKAMAKEASESPQPDEIEDKGEPAAATITHVDVLNVEVLNVIQPTDVKGE